MERTDDSGRWISDDGLSWSLVEPSQAWLDERASTTDPEPSVQADPVAALTGIVAALEAIGPTATSAQVRSALIAARDAAAQAVPA